MVSDYISREEAEKRLFQRAEIANSAYIDQTPCHIMMLAQNVVHLIPASDVRPVVRGRWKNNHCSACGMMPMGEEIWECCDFAPPKFEWFMNFCPNCGADMRAEEGET